MAKATKKSPAAKAATPVKATATVNGKMVGYIVLNRGKPLALSLGENKPKNGVLEINEKATMFTRMQGAQGAINRTGKFNEGKKGSIMPDTCKIVRIDHMPAA